MSAKFLNRDDERETLCRIIKSARAELFILYGRRGVGKSALLQATIAEIGLPAIYYRATRRTLSMQLASLTEAVRDAYPDDHLAGSFASFDDFLAFMSNLAQKRQQAKKKEPVVAVLDELPYLSEVDPGLLTVLQHWWDDNKRRSNLKLFLSGSHISFMEKKVLDVAAPLYNRRTGAMKLEALDYRGVALFFPRYSLIDKIVVYAILGGMPSYLEQFNPDESIQENVKDQILRERTYLSEEPEWLLLEDLRKDITYGSILRAIAHGARKPSDIARAIGKESASDVTPRLATLQELGLVIREVPITEKTNPRSRSSLYLIADQYLDFWYRFVDPSRSLVARRMGAQLWGRSIAPALDQYVSFPTFERAARQYLWRALSAELLPKDVEFVDVGNWWGERDVEIDVVGVNEKRKPSLVGSCKWTRESVDVRDYNTLRDAVAKAQWSPDRLHFFFFSKSGFTPGLKALAAKDEKIILVSLKEMYEA